MLHCTAPTPPFVLPLSAGAGPGSPETGGSPRAALHCHRPRAILAQGTQGEPTPKHRPLPHQRHPLAQRSPGSCFPPLHESGWLRPATPHCEGSWRRIPASEEGSSQAAPSGPSKVSCLPQESSAPPALVSLCHCPALEVICCFINYLHTMGPLSVPEQHTLAFRSNALTSAHPGQTKCLCAAFPLLGPAPTLTSAPRPAPTTATAPPTRRDPRHTSLCRTGHPARLEVLSPGSMAKPSCVPIPHGRHRALEQGSGTQHSAGRRGLGGTGYCSCRLLKALTPAKQCLRASELPRVCRWSHERKS